MRLVDWTSKTSSQSKESTSGLVGAAPSKRCIYHSSHCRYLELVPDWKVSLSSWLPVSHDVSGSCLSFITFLFLCFIVIKLCNVDKDIWGRPKGPIRTRTEPEPELKAPRPESNLSLRCCLPTWPGSDLLSHLAGFGSCCGCGRKRVSAVAQFWNKAPPLTQLFVSMAPLCCGSQRVRTTTQRGLHQSSH